MNPVLFIFMSWQQRLRKTTINAAEINKKRKVLCVFENKLVQGTHNSGFFCFIHYEKEATPKQNLDSWFTTFLVLMQPKHGENAFLLDTGYMIKFHYTI
jgi:hypothetical protein